MERKKSRYFTLMIMPETSAVEVRRLRLSRRLLKGAAWTGGLLVIATVLSLAHSAQLWHEAQESADLRAENEALKKKIERLDRRIEGVGKAVDRMRQFDAKLRALTMVSDPDRNLAIGPVGQVPGLPQEGDAAAAASLRRDLLGGSADRSLELVDARFQLVEREATRTETSVKSLSVFLEGQRALLASTPSRRPTTGYVSSTYGMRVDPFTGLSNLHAGIDFSANIGTRVMSTADGVVIYGAAHGAYGNTIEIDHGNGLVTKYAHLSRIDVTLGERVRRGQTIGAVGNTGRSTGPHLHYEVRLRGVPQDPERYILE